MAAADEEINGDAMVGRLTVRTCNGYTEKPLCQFCSEILRYYRFQNN